MVRFSCLLFLFLCLLSSSEVFGQIPIAVADSKSIYEDTETSFNITDNDTGILSPIDPATVDLNPAASGTQKTLINTEGNWSVNSSGLLTYTPTLNYFGTASITYTVQNNFLIPLTSLPGQITVTVGAVNDAPAITDQVDLSTLEATALLIQLEDMTIEDPDNDPGDFILTVQNGVNYSRTGNTITPAANYSGNLTVNVQVSDGNRNSPVSQLIVEVTAVNAAPTITGLVSALSTDEDTALPLVVGNFTITDSDVGDSFTLVVLDGTGYAHTGNVITPNLNFNGNLIVRVVVNDGTANSNEFLAPVTVVPVNDIPKVTGQIAISTPEATPITIELTHITVEDVDTSPTKFTLLVQPQPADYSLSGNTVTPPVNFNGILNVPIIVNDGEANSGIFTLKLTVTAFNDAPTISAIGAQSTSENTATNPIAFTISDAETAVGALTVSATSSNVALVPNGGFSFGGSGANRNVIITPAANQSGAATITLTVSDGEKTATSVFQLSVAVVNEAPTISAITPKSTNEGQASAPISFTIADSDTPAGSLTVTGSSSDKTLVPDVNLVLTGNGANRSVTITPAANQTGTTTITLEVSDGSLTQVTTFLLTVTPVNDNPTISAIGPQTTAESTATPAIAFAVNDVETDATLLSVTGVSNNLSLVPNANILIGGTGAARTVIVTPVAGQNGVARITLTVSDGVGATPTFFQLTVSSFNDPPTITSIGEQKITEDEPTAGIPFTIGDADTPISNLTVTGSSSNKTLVPDANINFAGNDISRAVTITPAPNQNGTTTITLTVSDGTSSKEISFPVVVVPANDAPTISTIANQATSESVATAALPFTVADIDTDVTALTVSGSSSNAALVPNSGIVFAGTGSARTVTVTPASGQSGSATITIDVKDGSLTASTSFTLTVTSVNDAPTVTTISPQTIKEDTATPALPFTIGDAETPAASLTVAGSSSNKTFVPDANIVFGGAGANRTVTITPAANQFGSVTITLTVSDATANKQMAFLLTIAPVNDPPLITGQFPLSTPEETPLALLREHLIISDPDEDENFKVTLHPGKDYDFTSTGSIKPKDDFDGKLSVNVSVNDGFLESAIAVIVVDVSDVNLPPTINSQRDPNPIEIEENTSHPLTIFNLNISDPDNKPHDFKLVVSEGKNYTLSGPGKNIITPLLNYKGPIDVIVIVNDGKNDSQPFVVHILVVPKSEKPAISGQGEPLVTNEDEPLTLKISDFTVTGSNAGSYSLVISEGPNYTVQGLTITPALNINSLTINGLLEVGVQVGIAGNLSVKFMAQVYVVPINDAPEILVMETGSIDYEPGSGPISITELFDCQDIDSEYLNIAEIGILDSAYNPLNDELLFENNDKSHIRGVYDASRGILSLIGYATPEEYEQAIRSIKYNYRLTLDENGEQSEISTEPKKVYVELSDGPALSKTHERPIELKTSVDLDIPTAFTPNGDPINSTWAVRPITNSDQFDKTVIRVYNKRGLLVYESVGLEKEWDGTFNGEVLPMDTYYYTIDLQVSFVNKTYKGAVTILR